MEQLQELIYVQDPSDTFVERVNFMFRTFTHDLKYEQRVIIINGNHAALLRNLNNTALESMTQLVATGHIKKFRGTGSAEDAPFKSEQTSEATIGVLQDI